MTGSDVGIGDEDGVTRDEGGRTPYLGYNGRGVGEAAVILLTGEDQTPPPSAFWAGSGGSKHLRAGKHQSDYLVYIVLSDKQPATEFFSQAST